MLLDPVLCYLFCSPGGVSLSFSRVLLPRNFGGEDALGSGTVTLFPVQSRVLPQESVSP